MVDRGANIPKFGDWNKLSFTSEFEKRKTGKSQSTPKIKENEFSGREEVFIDRQPIDITDRYSLNVETSQNVLPGDSGCSINNYANDQKIQDTKFHFDDSDSDIFSDASNSNETHEIDKIIKMSKSIKIRNSTCQNVPTQLAPSNTGRSLSLKKTISSLSRADRKLILSYYKNPEVKQPEDSEDRSQRENGNKTDADNDDGDDNGKKIDQEYSHRGNDDRISRDEENATLEDLSEHVKMVNNNENYKTTNIDDLKCYRASLTPSECTETEGSIDIDNIISSSITNNCINTQSNSQEGSRANASANIHQGKEGNLEHVYGDHETTNPVPAFGNWNTPNLTKVFDEQRLVALKSLHENKISQSPDHYHPTRRFGESLSSRTRSSHIKFKSPSLPKGFSLTLPQENSTFRGDHKNESPSHLNSFVDARHDSGRFVKIDEDHVQMNRVSLKFSDTPKNVKFLPPCGCTIS